MIESQQRVGRTGDRDRRFVEMPLDELMVSAASLRDTGHGNVVTYSPKVFIPLTKLCRDVCHYCTFAQSPNRVEGAYLTLDAVLAIAEAGAAAGCTEALFTLGDRPESRYEAARSALRAMGYSRTVDYLRAAAALVAERTGLLPHINCGVLDREELSLLRSVSASMGLMLESAATRLGLPGGPHHGSPDKDPAVRLECIRQAGELRIPFTSGILVGIGETRAERLHSLEELAALHERYGHLQEIIVQNFVPKPGTLMSQAPPPADEEMLWTVAVARHVFGPEMSIQAPPNLNADRLAQLIGAGINDWGGVSPLTPDHVNPESPWPHLRALRAATAEAGMTLVPRLTVYPRYVAQPEAWLDVSIRSAVQRLADAEGYARGDAWAAGGSAPPPGVLDDRSGAGSPGIIGLSRSTAERTAERAATGAALAAHEIVALFGARGSHAADVCRIADGLRRDVCGAAITYVVNRNINYTNVCGYHCGFCAFSKGTARNASRDDAYFVDLDEVGRRTREAWDLGATEVCMQGGIHPAFDGNTYLDICRAAAAAAPGIHIHAFSPLEITHGAATLGISIGEFLQELRGAGLGTLPGTAAEILVDSVRARICPDKITSGQWLAVVEAAHAAGLRTTSTIMFGHVDNPGDWAEHLLKLRALQERTGGITEFVPLPFVHMEAPIFRRGASRAGPTFREAVMMHAIARLVLHPHITNIQTSWPKLGPAGAAECLNAGANDLGGALMNESISRAAGAVHGQTFDPRSMIAFVESMGRVPKQRTTLYGDVAPERSAIALAAGEMLPVLNRPAREYSGV